MLAVPLGIVSCGESPADPPARGPESAVAEVSSPGSGELLIATPPAGWSETAALETPTLRMAEYAPPGAAPEIIALEIVAPDSGDPASGDPEDGTAVATEPAAVTRLTLEAQNITPLPDPIEFLRAISIGMSARCDKLSDTPVQSGLENAYPTSVRLAVCPAYRDRSGSEVALTKAIRGNERFYVISLRHRGPPISEENPPLSAQQMAEWTSWLRGVQLCDTRTAEHPCPEGAVTETTRENASG